MWHQEISTLLRLDYLGQRKPGAILDALNLVGFFIIALLSLGGFRLSRIIYRDLFAPLGLFVGLNLGSLALYQLQLLPLTAIQNKAYILIAGSLLAFSAGSILGTPDYWRDAKPKVRSPSFPNKRNTAGLPLFFFGTALLASFGWILQLFFVIRDLSFDELIAQPYVLQVSFQQRYIGYLNLLGILVLPGFVLFTLNCRRFRLLGVLASMSALFGLLLAGIKSYLVFSFALAFLVFTNTKPGKLGVRHLLFLALFLIGFMGLYDRYIDTYVTKQFPGSRIPGQFAFLERPYLYMVGAWPAMSIIMEKPLDLPVPAYHSLNFAWKMVGSGLGMVGAMPLKEPYVNIGAGEFNVYTFIGGLYSDFGWIGTVLGCFVLGFSATYLYCRAQDRKTWIASLTAGIVNYGIFISFFSFYYRFNLIFLIVYTALVGGMCAVFSANIRSRTIKHPRGYSKTSENVAQYQKGISQ